MSPCNMNTFLSISGLDRQLRNMPRLSNNGNLLRMRTSQLSRTEIESEKFNCFSINLRIVFKDFI